MKEGGKGEGRGKGKGRGADYFILTEWMKNRFPLKYTVSLYMEVKQNRQQPNQREKTQIGREERDKFNDRREIQILTVENRKEWKEDLQRIVILLLFISR